MKYIKKIVIAVISLALIITISSCGGNNSNAEFQFNCWNDCDSLNSIKEYVADVTDENSKYYIPEEDRIAVFDMDGTLCGEVYPTYFEYLLCAYRILDDPNYKDIADEESIQTARDIRDAYYLTSMPSGMDLRHLKAQTKAFSGMTIEKFDSYVKDFMEFNADGFENLKYKDSFYKPMVELIDYLNSNNFLTYIVSGSDRFICRSLADGNCNIPANRIIGTDILLVSDNQGEEDALKYTYANGDTVIRTDEYLLKNLQTNKVKNIVQEIGKQPVLSFGNSSGDASMHNYTVSNNKYKAAAYMVLADDNERDHPDLVETEKRRQKWVDAKYNIISMKNDFKIIYGENIVVTELVKK